MSETQKNPVLIALTGKGGVGKTTLSSAIVRILTEAKPGARILAIDADPAVGLSTALGVQVETTLDDIRKDVILSVEGGSNEEAIELLAEARFRILDTLVEQDNFSFLAIGRPEGAGCYCKVNSYLRNVIELLSKEFDYVVIDGEAGIEQVNRRVMEKVTHLILVSDPSKKGREVIQTIRGVADDLVMYDKCGVIVNRVEDASLAEYITIEGTEILSLIPSDSAHAANDIKGQTIFELPEDAPIMKGAKEALEKLGLL